MAEFDWHGGVITSRRGLPIRISHNAHTRPLCQNPAYMSYPPVSPEEISEVIDDLKQRGLLIAIDGRFVALAVRGDIPRLPTTKEFPGGYIDEVLLLKEIEEKNPSNSSGRAKKSDDLRLSAI